MRHGVDRRRRNFVRGRPRLIPRERVLVVCEGAKTEPFYVSDCARDLGLSGTDVRVCGEECGSDPVSVVRFAAKLARAEAGFDHVYCVVDKDKHAQIAAAAQLARTTKIRGVSTFQLILSVPCFEYWLLIHFGYCAKPFAATGKTTVGGACVKELEKHIPGYGKGSSGIYDILKPRLPDAITNAERREAECAKCGTDNPSTDVHKLVGRLQKIADDAAK